MGVGDIHAGGLAAAALVLQAGGAHRLQDGVELLDEGGLEVAGVQRPALVVRSQVLVGGVAPVGWWWWRGVGGWVGGGELMRCTWWWWLRVWARASSRLPVPRPGTGAHTPSNTPQPHAPPARARTCCRRWPRAAPPQTCRTRVAQCAARRPGRGCPPPAGAGAGRPGSRAPAAWHHTTRTSSSTHQQTRQGRCKPLAPARRACRSSPCSSTPVQGAERQPRCRLRTCLGGQNAFLILVLTSASLSSMKIALLGSLLLIFSWPCRHGRAGVGRRGGVRWGLRPWGRHGGGSKEVGAAGRVGQGTAPPTAGAPPPAGAAWRYPLPSPAAPRPPHPARPPHLQQARQHGVA